jgi:glycosyltransferase involved in cell wall biosynthesis
MADQKEKNKIRILLVVRWPVGGIRTFMRYVYNHFDSDFYDFSIVAPNVTELKVLLKDLEKFNLKYIHINKNPSNFTFIKTVSKLIIKERFDLVNSHGFTSGISSIIGALISWTPHLLTSHDVFTKKQFIGFRGSIKKWGLSVALTTPNKIHSVSYDAQSNLLNYIKILRLFRYKMVVIPNGINVDHFVNSDTRNLRKELLLTDDYFLIGFLGRFMSQKGFKYLVNALQIILNRKDLPKKPLILTFGEGGFLSREKREIKKKNIEDNFIFLPFVKNVAPTLKGLDLVVMPSLWEACGLLAMEAIVAGVPLVSTSCIGLREVVSKTPSRVVPPGDSESLASAIIDEMINPTKVDAMKYVNVASERFDVKKSANKLKDVIDRLAKKQLQSRTN